MCVGDWRLGTLIRTVPSAITLTTAGYTVPANPNRVGIMFRIGTVTASGALILAIDDVSLGLYIQAFSAPEAYYYMEKYGDMPTRRFFLDTAAGTVEVSIVEFIAPTGMIAAGLDEFRRQYPGSKV